MSAMEMFPQDREIPELAVEALTSASRRARQSGRSLVLVVNGNLIETSPAGTRVLRKLPTRKKVSVRVKRAQP